MRSYTYLALGDSYTIGEAVTIVDSFPYQAVQLLRDKGHAFCAPELIAKTGWTTDELFTAIKSYRLLTRYDFVSLLIGVNNQYRGRDIIEYKEQLQELIEKALVVANNKKEHVFLISIPDYSVTPFGQERNPENIRSEIEMFNGVGKALSVQYKIQFIEITVGSREAKENPELLASDSLHPSAKEYEKWAKKLADAISIQLK